MNHLTGKDKAALTIGAAILAATLGFLVGGCGDDTEGGTESYDAPSENRDYDQVRGMIVEFDDGSTTRCVVTWDDIECEWPDDPRQ